jgi:putative hydrolase of the HAD superfamily
MHAKRGLTPNNNQMGLINVILTDLDGVIRHWNNDPLYQKEVDNGLARGYLYAICFEEKLLSKVVTGKITDAVWRIKVKDKLARSLGQKLADELVTSWTNAEAIIDNTIIDIYREYFPASKLVLTTNATSRLDQDMEKQDIDTTFDEVFNSSELGVAKPSHDYFNEVLSRLGVRIEELIFIDDSLLNVESAGQLGIRSHQYRNHAQLVSFLLNIQRGFS